MLHKESVSLGLALTRGAYHSHYAACTRLGTGTALLVHRQPAHHLSSLQLPHLALSNQTVMPDLPAISSRPLIPPMLSLSISWKCLKIHAQFCIAMSAKQQQRQIIHTQTCGDATLHPPGWKMHFALGETCILLPCALKHTLSRERRDYPLLL